MTKILAISGRLQAGKTTAANFVFGLTMLSCIEDNRPMFFDHFSVNEQGLLVIPNADKQEAIFDPLQSNQFMAENVWPLVKMYYFADKLKAICIDVLGLTYEQCYGTDEQKNSPTKLRWADLPGVTTNKEFFDAFVKFKNKLKNEQEDPFYKLTYSDKEYMTGREVMQQLGTEYFRKLYPQVWVDSTINAIKREDSELAIIGDVRFPNEVQGVQNAGGKVIRLLRNPHNNNHPSETALDDYVGFDKVIDNREMTIAEQNKAVYDALIEFGYVEYELSTADGKYE